jgi:RNA-directed DNA polymerase
MSREVHVRFCESRGVRFPPATHLVVMVSGERHHAEALLEEVTVVLAPLGLRLSPDKTRVVHIDEGLDFLGFHIRRMRKRGTGKHVVYTVPSKKAIQQVKDTVKAKTSRATLHLAPEELIVSLNRSLQGWATYFQHAVAKDVFGHLDQHAWRRLANWLRRKHRIGWKQLRRRFCDQGWRIAYKEAMFTGASSVPVTRYRYRGSTIPTPWTPTPAATTG